MSKERRDNFGSATIADIGYSMLRFHGEERALELARHYSSISSNEELWRAVVGFLEERAVMRAYVSIS